MCTADKRSETPPTARVQACTHKEGRPLKEQHLVRVENAGKVPEARLQLVHVGDQQMYDVGPRLPGMWEWVVTLGMEIEALLLSYTLAH